MAHAKSSDPATPPKKKNLKRAPADLCESLKIIFHLMEVNLFNKNRSSVVFVLGAVALRSNKRFGRSQTCKRDESSQFW